MVVYNVPSLPKKINMILLSDIKVLFISTRNLVKILLSSSWSAPLFLCIFNPNKWHVQCIRNYFSGRVQNYQPTCIACKNNSNLTKTLYYHNYNYN